MQAELQPSPAVTPRLPSLDGWRAVSILMVLGHHSTFVAGFPYALTLAFNLIFDGRLGVRFFFIISGFLITWLMIVEKDQKGFVNLREFYIRRCLRILPIYAVFLCVLAVLDLTGLARESSQAWIGNLTFTRNLMGDTTGGDSFSAHLWSLSVEEQFYLVWPALLFLLWTRSERSIPGVIAIVILAAPAVGGIDCIGSHFGFYSDVVRPVLPGNSLSNFDFLAFGCGSAVLFARRRGSLERHLKSCPVLAAGVGIALIFFPHYSNYLALNAGTAAQFGPSLQALGFSILLLHSIVMPDWDLYRILNRQWVRQLGIWSYSLYIWQQLFWRPPQYFGLNHIWWMGIWAIPLLRLRWHLITAWNGHF